MQFRQKAFVTLFLIGIIGLTLVSTLVHLLTESWWFEAVGFADVFWRKLTWQTAIWLITFIIYSGFLWFNYWLALRLSRDRSFRIFEGSALEPHTNFIARLAALVAISIVAVAAANTSAAFWETSLKFLNSNSFGNSDPIYNRDIGFYLFTLPFFKGLQNWLLALLLAGIVTTLAVYLLKGIIKFNFVQVSSAGQKLTIEKLKLERQWQNYLQGKQRNHIIVLLIIISIAIAADFWLERYDLLYSPSGVVWGAGYTDTHARLFSYWVMGIGAIVLAVFMTVAVVLGRNKLPFYGIIAYVVILFLVNGIYPDLQQRFSVEPNELDKELPYIKHSIKFTQQAYDLTDIKTQDYPVSHQLTAEVLEEKGTIQNIRLWDYRPLLSTYRQLQEIRPYYQFNDVDIDRYTLDGTYRQVMLSPRELSYDRVPQRAKTWVNQRLKYTHGYGVVMSPVNQVTSDGLPVLSIKNIPPISQVDLAIEDSAIYYGEETKNYIFTGANTPEFDYPQGNANAFTKYEGKGGVPLNNWGRQLAYAYDFGSIKILISNYFTKDTRIHYYRQILDRVSHVAPFLELDDDPYITIVNGKLKWIIDAYTTSDRFPYSEPAEGGKINYIRNSVKVVVDAKDGTMEFVIVDEQDPVLKTYRQIFPNLFVGQSAIDPEISKHFRYPTDLFKIQAQMYLSYHMDNPEVFYNREDLWRFATENYEGNQQAVEPYYQIMNLPGEEGDEFALILPFTPVSKDNMIAWMAARSDGENYGKLLLYEFPKQELIYGPFQIEARIDQNPEISGQLTLWSQKGSRVIRGDILVIPIKNSLLYVEPVYLRAEQGELPELRRVIVAYDKEVVMRPNLESALAAIFGNQSNQVESAKPEATTSNNSAKDSLIQQAAKIFQQAESAQRAGNWAEYGRYQQQLKELFQKLE